MKGEVHIVGPEVTVGHRMRQRCSWCGAIIFDYDLANIAVANKDDGSPGDPPRGFEEGRLCRIEGEFPKCLSVLEETDKVPEDCCAMVDDEVTA